MTELWPTKESISKRDIESKEHYRCKYTVVDGDLGSGTYATVKEIIHNTLGYHYAVKIIKKNLMSGREMLIQNEISVLQYVSRFNHKNLLMLNDYFETNNDIYLVTDLCTGGDLFEKIAQSGSYYERDAIHIVKCITSATLFLHENGIIHRDLKSENLIFKTRSLKSDILIADFGLAKIRDDPTEKLTLLCGTLSYVAPEVLVHKHRLPQSIKDETQLDVYQRCKETGYSYPVDVWSIGVLAYFILCGYMPFDCETDDETREAIMTRDFYYEPEEYWSDISGAAKDFINKCFNLDPYKRISVHDLNQHLLLTSSFDSNNDNLNTNGGRVDLLPRVRSNYSLHKMGISPRQSPSHTPQQLSPQQSYTNVQELMKRTTSASSMISMNRLNQSLMALNQHRSQQYVPTLKRDNRDGGGGGSTMMMMMESITATPMKVSHSQLSHHGLHAKKTYLEESRKALSQDIEWKMNGVLSEEPAVVQMESLAIKSEAVSRANSNNLSPTEIKRFYI